MTTVPIVGAFFHPPAKVLLEVIPVGAELILRAEPDNAHDPNAISVWLKSTWVPSVDGLDAALASFGTSVEALRNGEPDIMLGYVPRALAAELKAEGDPAHPAFPDGVDVPGEFTVGPNGGPRARFDLTDLLPQTRIEEL